MIPVELFISKIEQIAAEEPSYQHGGDGSHGQCDCIGLIIGAIRRAGGQWRGLHGSNYAARRELTSLPVRIAGTGELHTGDVVFKAYEPGQGGYDLPERYEPGGEAYTGDLRDYYHVGVVVSVYPLRIRHMTTPRPKLDTSIGKWSYYGQLKKIDYSGGEARKTETVIISGGDLDAPIRMRAAASKTASVIANIPQGSTAELIEGGGQWNRIKYDGKTGYVMSEFVRMSEAGETITVDKAELEKAYDIIGGLLGLKG